jgi:hypothetical protein
MNEIEKAIKELEIQTRATTCTVSIKSCCLAIQALEKQIPNKATVTIPYRAQKCSYCDNALEPFWDYCPYCGQAFENVI